MAALAPEVQAATNAQVHKLAREAAELRSQLESSKRRSSRITSHLEDKVHPTIRRVIDLDLTAHLGESLPDKDKWEAIAALKDLEDLLDHEAAG